MRKVFLDELPKKKYGNKLVTDWKNSIGYGIPFVYDNTEGKIEIVNYLKKENNDISYLKVKYKNIIYDTAIDVLVKCQLSTILKIRTKEYKYNINDIIDTVNNGKLQIQKQTYIKNSKTKGYQYKCLICNNIDVISEYNLNNKNGCNVCAGRKVLIGYNDIATTNPEYVKYFVDINDTYIYSKGVNKKVKMKCPDCGYIKNMLINGLNNNGFSCPKCGDGVSYPEKFMYNVLDQLSFKFEKEIIFDWSKNINHFNKKLSGNKIYDFYIPLFNCIIEVHGLQHYEEFVRNNKSRILLEEQENDRIKEQIAIQNGVEYYVIIDCRKSGLEYIRNNILNSRLANLFDLSKIDWLKCHQFACNNLVKVMCTLWNSGKTLKELSCVFKLGRSTVRKYLKQGTNLEWCNYNAKKEMIKNGKNANPSNKRKVICINTNEVFDSISKSAKHYNLYTRYIIQCCKGKINFYGKHPDIGCRLKWMYYDDWQMLTDDEKQQKKIIENKIQRPFSFKKVICLNDSKIFESIKSASEYYSVDPGAIPKICRKTQKSTKGYRFVYYEDWLKQKEYDIIS